MTRIPERGALQPERTALAWQRTSLVAALVALPVVVLGGRLADWLAASLAAVAAVGGAAMTDVGRLRQRELRDDTVDGPHWLRLLAVAGVVTLTALAAVVVGIRVLLSAP